MKSRSYVLLLSALLLTAVQARAATVLQGACGDDSSKFDVTAQEDAPKPAFAPPSAGKSLIVFIERNSYKTTHFGYATVRFGIDGSWIGANYGNSYLTAEVDPGVHHVCANWQPTSFSTAKKTDAENKNAVDTFTAEAGKVYFIMATVVVESHTQGVPDHSIFLSKLSDDEGASRVKEYKHTVGNTESSWLNNASAARTNSKTKSKDRDDY
ncbi:MAG: hypothetical protein ABR956_15930 [Terracidiphilus sp.]